jgi:putative cell wall-binding protein
VLLTNKALENNVPPEILKGIAMEESAWDQYAENQESDGRIGIGIMQVTDDVVNGKPINKSKLRTDICYNIQTGIDILKSKADQVPTINDEDPKNIENWYLNLLSYNGKVHFNSPVVRPEGERNICLDYKNKSECAYQEKLFTGLSIHNGGIEIVSLPFTIDDVDYLDDNILGFNKEAFDFSSERLTRSKYFFQKGDIAYTVPEARVKTEPSGTKSEKLASQQLVTILDSDFYYDTYFPEGTHESKISRHFVRYKVKLADGRIRYIASSSLDPVTTRIQGPSRYHTAAKVSEESWETADTVILATGDNFPDALAGVPLAVAKKAPILLVHESKKSKQLPNVTKNEISRLGAKYVYILGSNSVIAPEIEIELKNMKLSVTRLGGSGRYETASIIAKELGETDRAVVVNGTNFPDALAIASYAAQEGMPILLTPKDKLDDHTNGSLAGKERVYIGGSNDVVSLGIEQNLKKNFDVTRLGGGNRYHTNRLIVDHFNRKESYNGQAYVAVGNDFADALTGAVLAAKKRAPLLLVEKQKENLHYEISKTIQDHEIIDLTLFGGETVLKSHEILAIKAIVNK